MPDDPEYASLKATAAEWEAEFARQKEHYAAKIHCQKGCTDCCHHLFRITELEAAQISKGLKELGPELRLGLEERARKYQVERARMLENHAVPDAWGTLPQPGMRLACPALADGVCQIYSHRPLVCRKYGIALYNPQKPDQIFACELNFKPGEEIEDSQLIQIQTSIHDRWAAVQREYNDRGGLRDSNPITVARALLEDFELFFKH